MRKVVVVLALATLTVSGAPANATGVPQTYSGSGEMGLLADYPAGPYLVEWDATGVWPDGRIDGCQLDVIAGSMDGPDEVLVSVAVPPEQRNRGSDRVSVVRNETILMVAGTGCTWSVTITPV